MLRYCTSVAALVLLVATSDPAFARHVAQTPSISGNGWVALALLIGFIVMIVMVVFGALHLEKRDARLGRRRDDGFLLPLGGNGDDSDDHFFHHH